jgi:hypothetical protein
MWWDNESAAECAYLAEMARQIFSAASETCSPRATPPS